MGRVRWLVLAVVSACSFSADLPKEGAPNDGPVRDEIGVEPDALDERCFGHAAFYLCLPAVPAPGSMAAIGNGSIDTTTCTRGAIMPLADGTPACVIAADRITHAAASSAGLVGDKPLVLLGVTEVRIEGGLDASSVVSDTGPNANPASCVRQNGTASGSGGGGGAGGSLGGAGGDGGDGAADGGTAEPALTTFTLRGGCPGGNGGAGNVGNAPAGGPGGGAVYVVARGTVILGGRINANGGGGVGTGGGKHGGGGGGAGGMIVVDAGTLTVLPAARIVANGGGGAAGSGQATAGGSGGVNDPAMPSQPAAGGGSTVGGAGGDGAAGAIAPQPGLASGGGGGGGGGGGAGAILVRGGTLPAAQVSPAATPF